METYVVREPLQVTETLVNRILSAKYVDENGCWIWTRAIDQKGYGRIVIQKQQLGAYVASWRVHNGGVNVPQGLCVMHTCDNSKCINPDHLKLGTHEENMRHAKEVGRLGRGQQKPQVHRTPVKRIFTQSEVLEMRRLRHAERLSYVQLGKRFNCHENTASQVCRGITNKVAEVAQ